MTTYGTFDIDSVPPPSDFELEAADLQWFRDALIEAQDAADELATQQDALGVLF